MNLVDRFLALKGRRFKDEDGEEYELALLPPMSDADIAAIEKRIPCPIPAEIRAVLKVTRGFENGPLESFEIGGLMEGGFGHEEIFPHPFPIAHDGFGNYWVVDLLPGSTSWGPIYYACHDVPAIIYQCASLSEFLDGFVEMAQPPHKGPLNFVHEEASFYVWDREPNATMPTALRSADPELRAFAETLDDSWLIVDLRNAKTGDGFAWGLAIRPESENIKRWKALPIFAYRQKKNFFQRLFGN